ncbi:MAG: hypothetical protein PSV36_17310 [Algoriphagus sp.]|nr:hypothetical protein [Algoriphagus sp.]
MKYKIWKAIIFAVLALVIGSYLLVFKENKLTPELWNIPFIFWSGFLITVLVVALTFLGSVFFPFDEPKKQ